MNVKIFSGSSISEIEKEINEWIVRPPRNIKFVTQSESCNAEGGEFTLTITVFHDE